MIKKVNINMGTILNYYALWVFFNCHEHPPVNCTSQVTLRNFEQVGTGTVSGSCNLQVPLFTTAWKHVFWPEVAFSKTCLEHRSV
jgi:hypothetical protein